ncbi:MAG: hypothetical protein COV67_02695 [Nitrospinae bacterium CG11_big_fil_rev_8_21_14_0_20_56_8]|nr:MAG: hypothetical protein COV67_02695 [Nitrospinae bacterium CG11_big_fil_rev_8_21_14_0_20_56_8]
MIFPTAKAINTTQLEAFLHLIGERIGLKFLSGDSKRVVDALNRRMGEFSFSNPEEYFQLLSAADAVSGLEWEQLAIHLINGETYFFRDQGQFFLLETRILPELIQNRVLERKLRIWSAGCATGEEPYSIAILIDKLLPGQKDWDIRIQGTDLNGDFLVKAEKGIYGQNSFRGTDPAIKDRYFKSIRKETWALRDPVRKMVTFQCLNLRNKNWDALSGTQFDLILCRNVFIYFNPKASALTANQFSGFLREDGYLVTGHGELDKRKLKNLHSVLYPESVVYKPGEQKITQTSSAKPDFNSEMIAPEPPKPAPNPISLIHNSSHRESRPAGVFNPVVRPNRRTTSAPGEQEERPDTTTEPDSSTLLKRASLLANRGAYDEARKVCSQALKNDPLAFDFYYLLAQIAREIGDVD